MSPSAFSPLASERKKILLIEDDPTLGESLRTRLARDYDILWLNTFARAFQEIKVGRMFDLAILDVGLPDGNGFDLALALRSSGRTPLIFLTAQSDAESRLRGFEIGADEYIPKPFHLKELLIRIEHVLKSHVPSKQIELSQIIIDFSAMSVRKKNGENILPALTDLKVLQLLIDHSPKVLSRNQIIDAVWGVDENASHRTVDNIVVRLRQLLGEEDKNKIRSVRGVGYQWSPAGGQDE